MVLAEIFLQPAGLYAALAAIPILILYLLRPKPRKQTIPSLMFLLRDKGKKTFSGFLRRLVTNLLLLIHLLAILLFALALAKPYLDVPAVTSASNTIIVLDSSASMQARDDGTPRYQKAREHAIDRLSRDNTIILAGAIPEVALANADRQEAQTYLQNWQPSDQPTHLRPAILEAQQYAEEDAALTIISDFRDTEQDTNYQDAIKTIQALGVTADLEHVGAENTNNIGIIDVDASDTKTTIAVRNYKTVPTTVQACIGGVCRNFNLQAQETQEWTFSTPPGISEVLLDTNDDFPVDDKATISAEQQTQIDVLVVTNGDWQQSSLKQALDAIQRTTPLTFNTRINRPPQLTDVNDDLIIYHDVDPQLVVARTTRETVEAVRAGSAAIITHQPSTFGIPYGELLPVTYQAEGDAAGIENTDLLRPYIGMNFGSTPTHHATTAQQDTQVIAQTSTASPVIALKRLGSGSSLYYGLPETASFTNNPEYPLFWKATIDELLRRENAQDLTKNTGEVIESQQPIQTPTGRKSGTVALTHTGTYKSPDKTIAANLANSQESKISAPAPTGSGVEKLLAAEERTRQQDLSDYALWALLALLVIEILYLKWRGDL